MLLYAHSKCSGSYSIDIQNMAEAAFIMLAPRTAGLHDIIRAAPAVFLMRIEQIGICLEQLYVPSQLK
jgi:hypothetical protein